MKSVFLALGLSLAMPVIAAPSAPAPKTEWYEDISIRRQTREFTEDVTRLRTGGFGLLSWDKWIDPAELPADLRAQNVRLDSFLAADADATGRVTACRVLKPSGHAGFDKIACKALVEKGQFDPLYVAPGQAVGRTLNISVWWLSTPKDKVKPMAPAMFPPKPYGGKGWPRRQWESGLRIEQFPMLAGLIPVGVKAKGTTSLDLSVKAATGVATCTIGVSAGDAALDKAACDAASGLKLGYTSPCDGCDDRSLPLQFVWAGKASHIRVPLQRASLMNVPLPLGIDKKQFDIPHDPADRRTAQFYHDQPRQVGFYADAKDFAHLPDRTVDSMRVTLGLFGNTKGDVMHCKTVTGSGNLALDNRLCALAMKRAKLTLAQDVFGDPISGNVRMPLKLDGIATPR